MPTEWFTFNDVFDAWDAGRFHAMQFEPWEELDTAMWDVACRYFPLKPGDPDLPDALLVYYATRLIHWEVENGGFAQVAMYHAEYLEAAEIGFLGLERPDLAALVNKARSIIQSETDAIDAARTDDIATAFEYMEGSPFDRLDDQLDEVGWCDQGEPRVEYMLKHRAELINTPPPRPPDPR